MGYGSGLNICERRRNIPLFGQGKLVGRHFANGPDKEPKDPAAHLVALSIGFKKLTSAAGLMRVNQTDLRITNVEALEWGIACHRRKRQAGRTPIQVLGMCASLVSDSESKHPSGWGGGLGGDLFAWSFMVSVADGLRWGDLLNAPPSTLVLMNDGLIGFAAKTKTRGKSEGSPRGESSSSYSV